MTSANKQKKTDNFCVFRDCNDLNFLTVHNHFPHTILETESFVSKLGLEVQVCNCNVIALCISYFKQTYRDEIVVPVQKDFDLL